MFHLGSHITQGWCKHCTYQSERNCLQCQFFQLWNSILLHSGLNPAWHFCLSTIFSCCLKMKSVKNIFGYIWEQLYRFSRGCKPWENLWNCSRKYTKMFKTAPFLGNKQLSFDTSEGKKLSYFQDGYFFKILWGGFMSQTIRWNANGGMKVCNIFFKLFGRHYNPLLISNRSCV